MAQTFVLLASGLKATVDVVALRVALMSKFKGLPDPFPATIDGQLVSAFDWSDNDGGNGGGGGNAGGPQKVKRGQLNQTFWRFPTVLGFFGQDRDTKFPPIVRYELCLTFENYSELIDFFNTSPGNELDKSFHWVQYVAVTEAK